MGCDCRGGSRGQWRPLNLDSSEGGGSIYRPPQNLPHRGPVAMSFLAPSYHALTASSFWIAFGFSPQFNDICNPNTRYQDNIIHYMLSHITWSLLMHSYRTQVVLMSYKCQEMPRIQSGSSDPMCNTFTHCPLSVKG